MGLKIRNIVTKGGTLTDLSIYPICMFHNNCTVYVLSNLMINGLSFFPVTYPLDLTKTRLQIQGEGGVVKVLPSHHYRGMLRTAYGIGTVHK